MECLSIFTPFLVEVFCQSLFWKQISIILNRNMATFLKIFGDLSCFDQLDTAFWKTWHIKAGFCHGFLGIEIWDWRNQMKPLWLDHDLYLFDQLIIVGLDCKLVLSPIIPLNEWRVGMTPSIRDMFSLEVVGEFFIFWKMRSIFHFWGSMFVDSSHFARGWCRISGSVFFFGNDVLQIWRNLNISHFLWFEQYGCGELDPLWREKVKVDTENLFPDSFCETKGDTLPVTDIATENGWLGDYFYFDTAYFQALCFREGTLRKSMVEVLLSHDTEPTTIIIYRTPFPYYFHITSIRIRKDMGMVWVLLTIKGGPVIGGPWNHPWFLGIWKSLTKRHGPFWKIGCSGPGKAFPVASDFFHFSPSLFFFFCAGVVSQTFQHFLAITVDLSHPVYSWSSKCFIMGVS